MFISSPRSRSGTQRLTFSVLSKRKGEQMSKNYIVQMSLAKDYSEWREHDLEARIIFATSAYPPIGAIDRRRRNRTVAFP